MRPIARRVASCRPRSCSRSGFTLVELLVVIAIIGLLAIMLLPSLQRARESGRRTECSNNIRQNAMGCQGFSAAFGRYPPGAASDFGPFGSAPGATGTSNGSSWGVYILPYIGQAKLLDNGLGTQWTWTDSGYSGNQSLNLGVIQTYICPSSPLAVWCPSPPSATVQRLSNSYAAILGTANPIVRPGSSTTVYTGSTFDSTFGLIADDGVLTLYGQVTESMVTDGLSNTLLLGEWSDWMIDSTGKKQDCRPKAGFAIGVPSTNAAAVTSFARLRAAGTTPKPCPHNTTTVRYAVNAKRGTTNGGWNPAAAGDGAGVTNSGTAATQSFGANVPINSAHERGAAVALADGSVRFLSDETDVNVLSILACRKDRTPAELGSAN